VATVSVSALLEAGVHFGHRVSRWNPKMRPFIFGQRNLIHIIDLKETLKGLIRATNFVTRLTAGGKKVLLCGTKRQAKGIVEAEALRAKMPYVSDRWIGGLLTNYSVVRRRLQRLFEIEKIETDGSLSLYNKKEQAALNREKRKLLRNLHGVRTMDQLPGALFVVDPRREETAVKEANRLRIPVVALLDTDCDPTVVDVPIPGNDDAIRAIQLVCEKIAEAALEGSKSYTAVVEAEEKERAAREQQRQAAMQKARERHQQMQRDLEKQQDQARERPAAPPRPEEQPPA
jgi:small subunit ribosomal protein S2